MIEIISIEEVEKWDAIVRQQKNYDVFYLASYAKAFEQQGEGQPILIHCVDGEQSAVSVMFKRDIADCEYFKDVFLLMDMVVFGVNKVLLKECLKNMQLIAEKIIIYVSLFGLNSMVTITESIQEKWKRERIMW